MNMFFQLAITGFAAWVQRQAGNEINVPLLEQELMNVVNKHVPPTTPAK